jgi:hypothetical protein
MKNETSGSRSNNGSSWAAEPIRARNAWRFRVDFMLKFYKSMPMLSKRNGVPARMILSVISVCRPAPGPFPAPGGQAAKKLRQFRIQHPIDPATGSVSLSIHP